MRKQRVTLEIRYDERIYSPPADWDWVSLLDLPDPDDVLVDVASRPEETI